MVSFEQVKHDPAIRAYVKSADSSLKALGYTEHSFAHAGKAVAACEYIYLLIIGHIHYLNF